LERGEDGGPEGLFQRSVETKEHNFIVYTTSKGGAKNMRGGKL
jgi:hypothetical protein